jgi:hypothetical protein
MKINKHILHKLNEQYLTCKTRYYKHIKAAEHYKNLYIKTTIPIILFSSITTVLASFNGNFMNMQFAIVVAGFSGLTTISQALASFLEYNTKFDGHTNSANKFINLARFIETEVYTNYYSIKTSTDEDDYTFIKILMEKIQKEFSSIQDVEPYIPLRIQSKTYKNVKCGTSNIDDDLFELNEQNGLLEKTNTDISIFIPNDDKKENDEKENSVEKMLTENPRSDNLV